MTNYLTVEKILREAEEPLSIKTIKRKAKERGNSIKRTFISSILNKMESKGKAHSVTEQVSRRQIKFWELSNDYS